MLARVFNVTFCGCAGVCLAAALTATLPLILAVNVLGMISAVVGNSHATDGFSSCPSFFLGSRLALRQASITTAALLRRQVLV